MPQHEGAAPESQAQDGHGLSILPVSPQGHPSLLTTRGSWAFFLPPAVPSPSWQKKSMYAASLSAHHLM